MNALREAVKKYPHTGEPHSYASWCVRCGIERFLDAALETERRFVGRSGQAPDSSTYHAVCLCGQAVASHARETVCPQCGRVLIFEWGAPPIVMVGHEEPK
jgi:hypothetical protein